ncbi:hypothetical protein VKT23_017679 [Stygiomarasmius scandens]|uniref:Uncharacterized protein n=1 Tax=Marasmiellus scandens TaxID=2682957 RepID=A0ABR1ITK3_9AGAR
MILHAPSPPSVLCLMKHIPRPNHLYLYPSFLSLKVTAAQSSVVAYGNLITFRRLSVDLRESEPSGMGLDRTAG